MECHRYSKGLDSGHYGHEYEVDPGKVQQLPVCAEACYLAVKRQEHVEAYEKVQIPKMPPGLADEQLFEGNHHSCKCEGFPVHYHVEDPEQDTAGHKCDQYPEHVFFVELAQCKFLRCVKLKGPRHHEEGGYGPHHIVFHDTGCEMLPRRDGCGEVFVGSENRVKDDYPQTGDHPHQGQIRHFIS